LSASGPVFSNFLHATGSYGEFNSYRGTVDVGLADANSRAAFRLNALWQDSENYRDDKNNDNTQRQSGFDLARNDKTSLTVNLEYVKSEYKPDSGLPLLNNQIPDVPRTQSYQLPSDISDQKILRGRLDFETHLSERFTLRNKFYYTDLDWKSDGTLLLGAFSIPQAGDLVGRVMNALDDRQELAGNQLEAMLHFNTGSVRHQILAGLELSRLGDEFTLGAAVPPPISLYSPQESATDVNATPFLINDARSLTLAPYLLDQIAFSEKFQTFAGGRFDVIDYKDTHKAPAFDEPLATFSTERDYQKFSPLLGVVYSPTREISFYANAGQAFGPPSTQIVEDIKAEESQQIEAGVKTQFFGGKLNAGLAAYQLEKNNLIIPDFTGFRYLSGEQRSRGFEVDIAAQPSASWQAFVVYAFNDAELTNFSEDILASPIGPVVRVDRSGNTPAFAPKHLLNVWTNKVFANRLGFGVGGRYLSEQFIDEDNAFKIDGIFLVDAMLYYYIGNWRWTLNAKNLIDAKYETRAFGSGSILPGNPLAIYGGIEFRL
jgi:iron complex outermembrane receptor protein